MTDEEKFESLKTEILSCLDHYADSVNGSDEDYSLKEFVTYLLFEVVDESERTGFIQSLSELDFELM